jgi:hypothetical protein
MLTFSFSFNSRSFFRFLSSVSEVRQCEIMVFSVLGCDFVNWIGNRIAISDRLYVVLAHFHVQSRLCITAVDANFLSRSLFGYLPKHEQSALSGHLDRAVRTLNREFDLRRPPQSGNGGNNHIIY